MAIRFTKGFVFKGRGNWRLAIDRIDEDGNKRRLTKSTQVKCYRGTKGSGDSKAVKDNRGKNIAESLLEQWREELLTTEGREGGRALGAQQLTFGEYAERLIDDKERAASVRNVTIRGYRSMLRKIIGTELGRTPIEEVTPSIALNWEKELVASGLGKSTLSHAHVFAKQVCIHAVLMGDIASNPFDAVKAPSIPSRSVNSLNQEQARALSRKLDSLGPSSFSIAVRLALMTGMRRGEICALSWRNVNFANRTISVVRALSRTNKSYSLETPKTKSSVRTIPFGETLERALKERYEKMRSDRAEFGLGWDDSLFVAGKPLTGDWCNPQTLGREWHTFALVERVIGSEGEVLRFHDLRHTFATLSIASGVDVMATSAILGHASPNLTLSVYADALANSKKAGMQAVDALLGQ